MEVVGLPLRVKVIEEGDVEHHVVGVGVEVAEEEEDAVEVGIMVVVDAHHPDNGNLIKTNFFVLNKLILDRM